VERCLACEAVLSKGHDPTKLVAGYALSFSDWIGVGLRVIFRLQDRVSLHRQDADRSKRNGVYIGVEPEEFADAIGTIESLGLMDWQRLTRYRD
jgi:hypothetical protein